MSFALHLARLFIRFGIFLMFVVSYFKGTSLFEQVLTFHPLGPPSAVHIIWLYLMLEIIVHFIPPVNKNSVYGKVYRKNYSPPPVGYDRQALSRYVSDMNIRALKVFFVWLFVTVVAAALIFFKIIGSYEAIMLSLFYSVCDLICLLFWCPFQWFFMKNRCCVNCRIYSWDAFMLYTPFVFVDSFFTLSLFFTGLINLLVWEITFALHPERFWFGSNPSLGCKSCWGRLCRVKRFVYRRLSCKPR